MYLHFGVRKDRKNEVVQCRVLVVVVAIPKRCS